MPGAHPQHPNHRRPTRRQAALLEAFDAFRRTMTEVQRRLAAASDDDVSMADLHTLRFVTDEGPVTAGEVAAFTGLTSGSVTSLLDRLEAAGRIERRRSPDDRRVVLVRARSETRDKVEQTMRHVHGDLASIFDGWSVERIAALVDLLDGLNVRQTRTP